MAAYKGKKKTQSDSGYQKFREVLKSHIFGRLYVFSGEEKYLMYWCRNALKKQLVDGPAEDFNYHRFDADTFNVSLLRDAIEAPPMMSEHTLVEVTDVNLFDSTIDKNTLAELLSDIPEYCTVLLVYDTVVWKPDKRSKLLSSAIDQNAAFFEFEEQSEKELIKWIQKRFSSDGFEIDQVTARYLIQQAGGYLQNLASESDKLISYCEEPIITTNDIDAIVIPILSAAIYSITEALSTRNYDQALLMLRNVLSQDVEPVRISASIGSQMRQLYAAKLLSENGKGSYDLSKLYGIYERRANAIYNQARKFKRSELKRAIQLCAEADLKLKRFSGDEEAVLTELLLKLTELTVERHT